MFLIRLLQFGMIISQHGWTLNRQEHDDDICGFCSCTSERSLVSCRNKNLIAAPHFKPGYVNPKVEYYWLNDNSIENIYSSDFQQFPNLVWLMLQNNKISNLPPEVFSNLSKLEILFVEGNKINVISRAVYEKLPSLRLLSTSSLIDCCNAYRLNQRNTSFVECGKTWLTTTKPPFKECGKRLCTACKCSYPAIDCSEKNLHHMPWTNSTFGQKVERFNISKNNIKKIWMSLLDNFPGVKYLDFSYNSISEVEENLLATSRNLTHLNMSHNRIAELPPKLFDGITHLAYLNLAHNKIRRIPGELFHGLTDLANVDFSVNLISDLQNNLLKSSKNLTYLNLAKNKIEKIPDKFFRNFTQLKRLDLSYNRLTKLPKSFFPSGNRLEHLILKKNHLKTVNPESLENLVELKTLDLSEMPQLRISNWKFLKKMGELEHIYIAIFAQCCFINKERPDIVCHAPRILFSTCERLIGNPDLRKVAMTFVVIIMLGNTVALTLRVEYDDTNYAQNFLIHNLNVADFTMGVYLSGILFQDLRWTNEYYLHDQEWRSGPGCKSLGALALISSEVGVMTLAVISHDRRGAVVNGIFHKKMKLRHLVLVNGLIWFVSTLMAIIPALVKSYFYDEEKGEGYYGTNALCLPLQLPGEKDTAWEYCLTIFGVLNLLIACYMARCYATIFHRSYVSARESNNQQHQSMETKIAIRYSAIVLTDILCWFPIAALIFTSLAGLVSDEENNLYAWFSICVTTINSAINPIIYTISTTNFWPKFKGWLKTVFCVFFQCCSCKKSEGNDEEQPNPAFIVGQELQAIEERGAPPSAPQEFAEVQIEPAPPAYQNNGDAPTSALQEMVELRIEPVPRAQRNNDDAPTSAPQEIVEVQVEPVPRAHRNPDDAPTSSAQKIVEMQIEPVPRAHGINDDIAQISESNEQSKPVEWIEMKACKIHVRSEKEDSEEGQDTTM